MTTSRISAWRAAVLPQVLAMLVATSPPSAEAEQARWTSLVAAKPADFPVARRGDFEKCRAAGQGFAALGDKSWKDEKGTLKSIVRAIEALTTRDYDRFEAKSRKTSMIFLEGASSSRHKHEAVVAGDAEIGGRRVRVVAVWSLAYGDSETAHDTERALSLLEYASTGKEWRLSAAGVGADTFVSPRTKPPRVVPLDGATYAVEVAAEAGGGDREAAETAYYVPLWGCFHKLTAANPSEALAKLKAELEASGR